jgi:hypothetical protein
MSSQKVATNMNLDFTPTMMLPIADRKFYYSLSQVKVIISDNARSPIQPVSAQRVGSSLVNDRCMRRGKTTTTTRLKKCCRSRSNKSMWMPKDLVDSYQLTDPSANCIDYISFRIGSIEVQHDFPPRQPFRRSSLTA